MRFSGMQNSACHIFLTDGRTQPMNRRFPSRRLLTGAGLALALSVLAACQSSEEKAEAYFQSGMTLIAAGDTDRALVEFRNVFQLNGQHRAARQEYARIQLDRGNMREAYSQYLRLVEQYPDDITGNLALAEMAMQNGSWTDAALYARRSAEAESENLLAQSLILIVDYRDALQARDQDKADTLLDQAMALLDAQPDLIMLRQFAIDEHLRREKADTALALADEGLAQTPEIGAFQTLRLAALQALGRTDEITTQLQAMVAADPGNADTSNTLIMWYLSQGDSAAAEQVLRARIDPAKDDLDPRVRLVDFIERVKGVPAAQAELGALMAANPASVHTALYRSLRAGYDFQLGRREEAVAELEKVLAEHPDAPQINAIKVTLATMLDQTGNRVGARALVEQVLAADRSESAALRLKAGWLIDDDKTGDALVTLRSALEQNPRDSVAMTLMARAHERDGNTDLMGEALAQAVEASGQAPAEALRYAAFLMQSGKALPAEDVLLAALRRQPENVQLQASLGTLYLQIRDWGRADHIIRTLEGGPSAEGRQIALELRARLLAASGQENQLTQYLEEVARSGNGAGAEMALVRDAVRRGEVEQALTQIAVMDAKSPDLAPVGLLHALVLNSAGKPAEAITRLQDLTAAHPDFEQGWLALYNLQAGTGDAAAAGTTLEVALDANPQSRTLQWARAGNLEGKGDIEGAIAIYEVLYAQDSNWSVVANNLASLLANSRSDAESLERAYVIARRLRGQDQPAFQDTYGWIAFRRGNLDEALAHLEPAARGLPTDLTVQYHLAMTYGALDRRQEALAILQLITSANPPPPAALLEQARAEIARIGALPLPAVPSGN